QLTHPARTHRMVTPRWSCDLRPEVCTAEVAFGPAALDWTDVSERKGDRVKRAFDLVVGGTLLVASLPVQAGVAIAIKRSMGSPVLFRQLRPGTGGVIFEHN